jgi:EmrB/QacA subfamily drug resistance transporter
MSATSTTGAIVDVDTDAHIGADVASTSGDDWSAPRAVDVAVPPALDPNRFRALAVIVVAQLMIVLDATVTIIALPSAQRALHISIANRQWVLTAYTLAFGGLLLLGGRVADQLGRKRMFILGLVGFAAASALGGLAHDQWMLFGARAIQGAMAAVMAPAALALLTVTFSDASERARAFGIYGAVAGGGSAVGMILGGLLTEYASWRWTLLINAPIAVVTAVAASRHVKESKAGGRRGYDVAGVATVTSGLMALLYGCTRAQTDGWGAPITVALLTAGATLVAAFVVIERRSSHPVLPLRVVLDGNRGGSYLVMGLAGLATFGAFLFLTYYLQQTLQYTPIKTGAALLPVTAGIAAAAGVVGRVLPRIGPRPAIVTGLAVAVGALLWLARIGVHTNYLSHLLAPELALGFGLGFVLTSAASTALIGVDQEEAGVASALLNASEQVSASVGIALLSTIAATATTSYLATHRHTPTLAAAAAVHGYTTGFVVSACLLAVAVGITVGLIRGTKPQPTGPDEPLTSACRTVSSTTAETSRTRRSFS